MENNSHFRNEFNDICQRKTTKALHFLDHALFSRPSTRAIEIVSISCLSFLEIPSLSHQRTTR